MLTAYPMSLSPAARFVRGAASLIRAVAAAVLAAIMLLACPLARAQCPGEWSASFGEGLNGTDGVVNALLPWDPDGAGPRPPVIVVGGAFTVAGTVTTGNIATWNPASGEWAALGAGLTVDSCTICDYGVEALAVMPNGDLVAGGRFGNVDFDHAHGVMRWNGSTWTSMGAVFGGASLAGVHALAALPNGDLIAGGRFVLNGVNGTNLAYWDGTGWDNRLGSTTNSDVGGLNGEVHALTVMPDGDVIAGGRFDGIGQVSANYVAGWNGTDWYPLGGGVSDGVDFTRVVSLAATPGGDLIVGGHFRTAGTVEAQYIARWNGTAWSAVGTGTSYQVHALQVMPNGDLIAGGSFIAAGGILLNRIARWNGTAWSALGEGLSGDGPNTGIVLALAALPNGDVVAGGLFTMSGGVSVEHIARWNGFAWSETGASFNNEITALETLANGDLVAGGTFTAAGGVNANRIARWNGSAWSPLGSGMGSGQGVGYGVVYSLQALPGGDLVAGGYFVSAGGVTANNVARWNGSAWSAFVSGSGCCFTGQNSNVFALALLPDTEPIVAPHGYWVVVGGTFSAFPNIARWSGTDWNGFTNASTVTNGAVFAIEELPGGGIVVGGGFAYGSEGPQRIVIWRNGQPWQALGTGLNDVVYALAVMPNGDIVAGGAFTTAGGGSANRIARWNGSSWSALGVGTNGPVYELEVMPNGDLIAGGSFTTAGGAPASNIARWNGTEWSPLGTGVNNYVHGLAVLPNGDLAVGGNFTTAGGLAANYIARWVSQCQPVCDPDFNCDGNPDQDDIGCIINVVAGNPGCECQDPDFNHDGNVDQEDVAALINVVAGGACP